jgi:hypothetical protein
VESLLVAMRQYDIDWYSLLVRVSLRTYLLQLGIGMLSLLGQLVVGDDAIQCCYESLRLRMNCKFT